MSLVSRADLITGVRRRAKIERQTKTITDAEISEYLQCAYSSWVDIITTQGSQDWLTDSRTFTTTSGTDTYALRGIATNFYRLLDVYVFMSGSTTSDVTIARRFNRNQRNEFRLTPAWGPGWPVWYRMMGDDLVFIPIPTGTYNVQINYIPELDSLDSDTSKVNDPNGWTDYIIWNAVADVRSALDLDPSYALQRAQQSEAAIREMAGRRDEGEPDQVTDVYANRRDDWL